MRSAYQLDIKFLDGRIERVSCDDREVRNGVLYLFERIDGFSVQEIGAYPLNNILRWSVVGS